MFPYVETRFDRNPMSRQESHSSKIESFRYNPFQQFPGIELPCVALTGRNDKGSAAPIIQAKTRRPSLNL